MRHGDGAVVQATVGDGSSAAGAEVVPVPGWWLFLLFAALLALAPFVPFASVSGQSDPFSPDVEAALPLLIVAAGAAAAGLAGRLGYDVGLAAGAGAVLIISVAMVFVLRLAWALFDFGEAVGGSSVSPGPGMIAFAGAALAGLCTLVAALGALGGERGAQLHPVFGVVGLGGVGVYLVAAFRPEEGEQFLTDDAWTNVAIVALIGIVVIAGLAVAFVRTGAAAALLGGVMLFPATTWYSDLQNRASGFDTGRSDNFEAMTIGLAAAVAAAVVGTFTCATRAVRIGGEATKVPARSHGALVVGLIAVGILAVYGLNKATNEDASFSSSASFDTGESGSFGGSFDSAGTVGLGRWSEYLDPGESVRFGIEGFGCDLIIGVEAGFDTTLSVLDDHGREAAYSDDANGFNPSVVVYVPEGATYTASVQAYGGSTSGSFDLFVNQGCGE